MAGEGPVFAGWRPAPLQRTPGRECLRYLRRLKAGVEGRTWRRPLVTSSGPPALYFAAGDSHAEFMTRVRVGRRTGRVVAFWMGPLLAHRWAEARDSVTAVTEQASAMLRGSRLERLVVMLVLGEIDIRTHCWPQVRLHRRFSTPEAFGTALAERVAVRVVALQAALAVRAPLADAVVVVVEPTPPTGARTPSCPDTLEDYRRQRESDAFPTFGPAALRLSAHQAYWRRLRAAITDSGVGRIRTASLWHGCMDEDGLLAEHVSSDGCHITDADAIAANFARIHTAAMTPPNPNEPAECSR